MPTPLQRFFVFIDSPIEINSAPIFTRTGEGVRVLQLQTKDQPPRVDVERMEPDRLSKLSIERKEFAGPRRRRWVRRVMLVGCWWPLIAVLGHLFRQGMLTPTTEVKVTSLSLVYPSQVITDLNASGYVVAQNKAAVASKGTGRLIALEVREGSRGQEGRHPGDVWNPMTSRRTSIKAGRNWRSPGRVLGQAQSELDTAARNWQRYQTLVQKQSGGPGRCRHRSRPLGQGQGRGGIGPSQHQGRSKRAANAPPCCWNSC